MFTIALNSLDCACRSNTCPLQAGIGVTCATIKQYEGLELAPPPIIAVDVVCCTYTARAQRRENKTIYIF